MAGRKDRAWLYFDAGLGPSSPEVKALGLKNQTRSNYFRDWRIDREKNGPPKVVEPEVKGKKAVGTGAKLPGGESIGGIDETKKVVKKEAKPNPEEATVVEEEPGEKVEKEANPDEGDEAVVGDDPGKVNLEKSEEGVGGLDETKQKAKGKGEVDVRAPGIRCIVFLSLQTLTLYEIAAAKQAENSKNGAPKLTLGDYLDKTSELFFLDRNLKLGLVDVSEREE